MRHCYVPTVDSVGSRRGFLLSGKARPFTILVMSPFLIMVQCCARNDSNVSLRREGRAAQMLSRDGLRVGTTYDARNSWRQEHLGSESLETRR